MKFSAKAAIVAASLLFTATLGLIYWVETLEWVAFPTAGLLGASLMVLLGVTSSVPLFKEWGGSRFGLSVWIGMVLAVIVGHVAFDMADPVDEYMKESNLVAQYVEGVTPKVDGVDLSMTIDQVNTLLGTPAFEEATTSVLPGTTAPAFKGYKAVYLLKPENPERTKILFNSANKVVCVQGSNLEQDEKRLLHKGDPYSRVGQVFEPNAPSDPTSNSLDTLAFRRNEPPVIVIVETNSATVNSITLADPDLDPWLREWEPFVTCDGLQLGESRASIEGKKKDHLKVQSADWKAKRHREALENCLYWDDLAVLLSDNEAVCLRGQDLEVAGEAIVSVGDLFKASLPHFTPYDVKKRDRVIERTMGVLAFPIEHKFEGLGKAILIKTDKDERVIEINLSESREKMVRDIEQLDDYVGTLDLMSSLFSKPD